MSPKIFRSLRAQVFLLIIAALVAAQAISAFLFADERSLAVQAAIGAEAAGRAANVARLLDEAPPGLHASILRAATSPLAQFAVDAEPKVDHLDHLDDGSIEARIRSRFERGDNRDVRVELHHVGSQPVDLADRIADYDSTGHLMTIEMNLSILLADDRWLNVTTRFRRPPLQWPILTALSFGLTAIVVLLVTLWFVVTRLVRPLRALSAASDRFGRGEEVPALTPYGPIEVRDLTVSFNLMQDRISRFIRDRTQMLAALGHDLRSPLTALRVHAEMVEEEETREAMVRSLDEMGEMVETTLAFAAGVAKSEPVETVELGSFLARLRDDRHGDFAIHSGPELRVRARPHALRRALSNLIENAERYGGTAEIRFGKSGDGHAVITISDRGPGIPAEELEHVFEPYVRLESSRSRETGGVGLGLSIARTFIRAHGGDVTLANREGGGLSATVTLPRAGAAGG